MPQCGHVREAKQSSLWHDGLVCVRLLVVCVCVCVTIGGQARVCVCIYT